MRHTSTTRYTIGLDYGSNSVRCLIVNCGSGEEIAAAVYDYPSGEAGVLSDPLDPHIARQSPLDFIAGIEATILPAIQAANKRSDFSPENIIGIGVDATASTPIPLREDLTPLAADPRFRDNLDAMAWMWKDHSAMDEAEAITELARDHRPHYLARCGGAYSSEWYFAKIWHCLNSAPDVFEEAWTWLEFADFIPAVLGGIHRIADVKAGICAAGHKAMYAAEWGGYPDREFLGLLAPQMAALRDRLPARAGSANLPAAALCAEWARRLGLPAGIPIAVGAIDAHQGAVGAGVATGRMVKILGTSACDILTAPADRELPDIPGVCGIVNGSVLPGHYGIEAGQTAVGDIFNWFVTHIARDASHAALTEEAANLDPGQSGLLALDWHNGNRSILVDARLTGLILGLTLHTTQAEIYRALIEATAFGARRILDRLEEYGVEVNEVITCGGIAEKNPMLMQIYADVLGRNMKISGSAQTCALGSAIMAAVAAGPERGGYATVKEAQDVLCTYRDRIYRPAPAAKAIYDELYALYRELHDSFGAAGTSFDHAVLMKKLLEIRKRARTATEE